MRVFLAGFGQFEETQGVSAWPVLAGPGVKGLKKKHDLQI